MTRRNWGDRPSLRRGNVRSDRSEPVIGGPVRVPIFDPRLESLNPAPILAIYSSVG
jgi:hypothetical protein